MSLFLNTPRIKVVELEAITHNFFFLPGPPPSLGAMHRSSVAFIHMVNHYFFFHIFPIFQVVLHSFSFFIRKRLKCFFIHTVADES